MSLVYNPIEEIFQLKQDSEITYNNFSIVESKSDLPQSNAGIINLPSGHSYIISGTVDLLGDRIVCDGPVSISGLSSETSFLQSTGLTGNALITTNYSLPMSNISISAEEAVNIDGLNTGAIDWKAVNFLNCNKVGTISNCTNFIMVDSALLNSNLLEFDGNFGTIGFDGCLFQGDGTNSILKVLSTCNITRRFRAIYSAVISFNVATGIEFLTNNVPDEAYILDTVSFSGGSVYLSGIGVSSNKTLFVNCTGIENTSVNGQMYMFNNSTITSINSTSTYVKISGTTIGGNLSKYLHSQNRLTCNAVISRRYQVVVTLSYVSTADREFFFGIYDSTINNILPSSQTRAVATNSTFFGGGQGRAESVTLIDIVNHTDGDYIEIYAANVSDTSNITVTEMNVVITEIK